jgi:hypothetical protein
MIKVNVWTRAGNGRMLTAEMGLLRNVEEQTRENEE